MKTATVFTRPLGIELDDDQKQAAGTVVHWSYGTLWGIGYALATRAIGHVPVLSGARLGVGLWALGDEIMVPGLGLAPKPQRLPLSSHAKFLGAHSSYGIGVELALRGFHGAATPLRERVLHA